MSIESTVEDTFPRVEWPFPVEGGTLGSLVLQARLTLRSEALGTILLSYTPGNAD